ncbi:MAG: GvpL/GvpF family gas vesicle protein [Deltaproteobacteria bacterium]|nr:GvpL/GvpF family gas vesicle protein [Deltaproteobacteria bacterium]
MKWLVYCVLRAKGERPKAIPPGVGGEPVAVVVEGPLGAALSRLPDPPGRAGLAPVLAYGAVVDAFASAGAVVPIRYGTLFGSESDVRALLRRDGERLERLLGEMEGHVEFTVLIALPASPALPETGSAAPEEVPGGGPGRSYLTARRAHYARVDEAPGASHALLERCRSAFEGLFTRSAVEARARPVAPGPAGERRQLASVSFLVPRGRIAPFQERFRALAAQEQAELALAGPRPPYSFVSLRPDEWEEGASDRPTGT